VVHCDHLSQRHSSPKPDARKFSRDRIEGNFSGKGGHGHRRRDGLGNQKRAHEAGAKAFLQKPVNDAELLAVIRQALGEPAGTKKQQLEETSN